MLKLFKLVKTKEGDIEPNCPAYFSDEQVEQLNALFDAGKTREGANLYNKIKADHEKKQKKAPTKKSPK